LGRGRRRPPVSVFHVCVHTTLLRVGARPSHEVALFKEISGVTCSSPEMASQEGSRMQGTDSSHRVPPAALETRAYASAAMSTRAETANKVAGSPRCPRRGGRAAASPFAESSCGLCLTSLLSERAAGILSKGVSKKNPPEGCLLLSSQNSGKSSLKSLLARLKDRDILACSLRREAAAWMPPVVLGSFVSSMKETRPIRMDSMRQEGFQLSG